MEYNHFYASNQDDWLATKPDNVLGSNERRFEMSTRRRAALSYLTSIISIGALIALVVYIAIRTPSLIDAEHWFFLAIFTIMFFVMVYEFRSSIVHVVAEQNMISVRRRSSTGPSDVFIVDVTKESTVFTSLRKNRMSVAYSFITADGKKQHLVFRSDEFGKQGLAWLERWLRDHLKAKLLA